MDIVIEDVSKRFGGLMALDHVSLTAQAGAVTAVIGPNGAGKTTLINCLSGLIDFDTGRVVIEGEAFNRIRRHELVDLGIARTFQTSRLWENLTVREHLLLTSRNFRKSRRASDVESAGDTISQLLESWGLDRKTGHKPHELSYGERRRLEIARCLATRPRLLLLDEPAAGFTLAEQEELAVLIRSIAENNVAVVLVEHHMGLVGSVSGAVVVLNFGTVLATGTIDEIRRHPEVISAYLGVSA